MEDVAVYGYITPLKVKIVLTLGLTDSVVRDADVTMVCHVSSCFFLGVNSCSLVLQDLPCLSYGLLSVSGEPILTSRRSL